MQGQGEAKSSCVQDAKQSWRTEEDERGVAMRWDTRGRRRTGCKRKAPRGAAFHRKSVRSP